MKYANPIIKRLNKEFITLQSNHATLNGVVIKTIYFATIMCLGALYTLYVPFVQYENYVLLAAVVTTFASLGLVLIDKGLTPIVGSLFSFAQGVMFTILALKYFNIWQGIVPLIIGITVFVFFLVLALYIAGLIKVRHKYTSIIRCVVWGAVLLYFLVYASSYFTNVFTTMLTSSVMFIVTFFFILLTVSISLVSEFNNIAIIVQKKLSKHNEWYASFGFMVSLIWVYLRAFMPLKNIILKALKSLKT